MDFVARLLLSMNVEITGFDFGMKASSIYQAYEPPSVRDGMSFRVYQRPRWMKSLDAATLLIGIRGTYSIRVFLHCGATWELCSQDRLPYPANDHPQQLYT